MSFALVKFNSSMGTIATVSIGPFWGIPSNVLRPLDWVARKDNGIGVAASEVIYSWVRNRYDLELVTGISDSFSIFVYTIEQTEVGGSYGLHIVIEYMGNIVFSGLLSDAVERRELIMVDAKGERNGRDEFSVWDLESERGITRVYAESFADAANAWVKIYQQEYYSPDYFKVCVERGGEVKKFLVNEAAMLVKQAKEIT